ncbi:MAG: hypothetical protein ACXVJD_04195 [Mucilaginibacter sp.]
MKTSITGVVIFITLSVLTLHLKAQDQDYVIPVYGDTLKCRITQPFMSKTGRYQASGMSSSKKIRIEDIREYYVDKDKTLYRAVPKSNNTSHAFMKVLENGKISLYEDVVQSPSSGVAPGFSMSVSSSTTTWYAGKGTTVKEIKISDFSLGVLFHKSKKDRKNDFSQLIADNKDVYDKFNRDEKFDFNEIRNIVHLYNTGEPYVEKETKKDQKQVQIGNRPFPKN